MSLYGLQLMFYEKRRCEIIRILAGQPKMGCSPWRCLILFVGFRICIFELHTWFSSLKGREKEKLVMGKGDKQGGVLVMAGKDIQLQNPLTMLKTSYLECEPIIKNWFVKQSLPAAVAVVTFFGLVVGGVSGYYLSTDLPLKINSKAPMGPILIGGGRLLRACNGAVLLGAQSGISCFMERLRGKEDVQSNLVAGFGAGVMASLVCGIYGTNAIKNGVYYALFYGGTFKVNEKWSQRPKKHDPYEKTKDMLSGLGLKPYEKNFRKGLLTDKTLPLINDSDLQEVKIPVGARRLILDHIQREEVMK